MTTSGVDNRVAFAPTPRLSNAFSVVKKFLRPNFLIAAFAAALFCAVLGAKWATFDRFGSAMPDWDQWDAEGYYSLVPWFEHNQFFSHFFHPHNEHRVVLTKLQNLTLTVLSGQWDARLQSVANALLHTTVAVILWLLAVRTLRPTRAAASPSSALPLSPSLPLPFSPSLPPLLLAALWLLAFALFGPPVAWQNVLGGFHSQQYWLLLTSLIAIIGLPFARPWSVAWWTAAAATVLTLFTMGSGFLAAVVILAVLGFRLLRRETTFRPARPTLILCTVLVAIGVFTRVEVYYHAHMQAKTLHDFFFSLLHSLQWPVPSGHDWLAIIMWLPWTLAAFRIFAIREPSAYSGQIIVALGGWVLLQLLATAYARGAGAGFPASRYMDTLTFGAMVNALSLAWLLCTPRPLTPSPRRTLVVLLSLPALALAWLGCLGFGLHALLTDNLTVDMPKARRYYGQAEAHLRGYLATDDPAQLAFPDIPYPSAGGLIDYLKQPSLRRIMPAVLRPPLSLQPSPTAPTLFSPNLASQLTRETSPRAGLSPTTFPLASARTWGSFSSTNGVAATGEWHSAPLTAPLGGWLKFEIAGQLGASPATLALELRDARTGTVLSTVVPSKVPGDTWRAAYARAPAAPFVVVARDQDPGRWFAFSAPVEVSSLSMLAWQATRQGLLLLIVSLVIAAPLALVAWLKRPRLAASANVPTLGQLLAAEFRPLIARLTPRPTLHPAPLPPLVPWRPLRPLVRLALAFGLFLLIWGTKLIAIDHYGSDLPYWDQWAKEGDYLLTPWAERHELWKNLFLPHNEHRIAPTLALNLALVVGGGQWDARVQCVASAALHAALAAGLFLWALARLPRRWAFAAGAVLLLATAPPIAWENVLGGFQSQFYFLAGFSFLALHLLLSTPALSPRWWLGLCSALLALVSMGSGLLVAVPLAALATVRLLDPSSRNRDSALTLAAAVFLGVLGNALRTPAPWHDTLHAKTAAEFVFYFARCLAWPLPQYPGLAPLLWLPWLTLLLHRLKNLRPTLSSSPRLSLSPSLAPSVSASTDWILAAGLWVLLQIAAVTYSRAAGGALPASRYGDIAALGLVLSFLSAAQLAGLHPTSRRLLPAIGLLWFALVATSISLATRDALAGPLPAKKAESLASERSVQAFILTDDYETFAKSPLPFPLADWLARILRRPDIRTILPTSVRAPLRVENISSPANPPLAPLPLRRVQVLTSPAEWRSSPLPPPTMAWWKFETLGSAYSATTLRLTPSSDPIVPRVQPSDDRWRSAYIPTPQSPSTLTARGPASHWLAFSDPVEMSALSYRTLRLVKNAEWCLAAGALLLLAAALALRRSGEASAPPSRPPTS